MSKDEQSETQLYAELGRKVLPELSEADSAHAELVAQIRDIGKKLNALTQDRNSLQKEYDQNIAAATCFFCKAVNAEGAAFCEECGKKLGKPKEYCEACSTMNYPGQRFCGQCGEKLPE